jgi:hypothetical protein
MVKAFLSTRTDPEAEAVEYCLSGTHTVSNHKGQKFDDEVARSAIIYAFINHMADALTHLELLQVFVCAGPNTYSISREQGAKKHHNHGQAFYSVPQKPRSIPNTRVDPNPNPNPKPNLNPNPNPNTTLGPILTLIRPPTASRSRALRPSPSSSWCSSARPSSSRTSACILITRSKTRATTGQRRRFPPSLVGPFLAPS